MHDKQGRVVSNIRKTSKEDLFPVQGHQVLLKADPVNQKAVDWINDNRTLLDDLLQSNGALLIRGFKLSAAGSSAIYCKRYLMLT